jgi:hypothetical protein
MNEVEYPPYSVSDSLTLDALYSVLKLSDKEFAASQAEVANDSTIENYFMVQHEVSTLKSIRDSIAVENQ